MLTMPTATADEYEEEESFRYTDDELVNLIRHELQNAETDDAAAIQEQRRDAFKAYYGQSPKKAKAGRSSHVSREVFDAVETIKAKMMRIFTSNRKIVNFTAEGSSPNAAEVADLKTSYVNHLFYKSNPGYELLEDALHDALLNKLCIFKTWWSEESEKEQSELTNIPAESLDAFLSQNPDTELLEVTDRQILPKIVPTPYGPQQVPAEFISADIEQTVDTSYTRAGVVPPEDFIFGSRSTGTRDADFLGDRTEYTKQELIAFGFDPKIVNSLSRDASLLNEYTDNARRSVDRSWRNRHDFSRQDDRELVYVWDIYIQLDMDQDGAPEWWQVVIGGNKLLSKERVKGHPYRTWSPYSISHKGVGMSVADVTIDLQRTMSSIIRGGVDNIWQTNNSQKAANLQTITNPQDLIAGSIGAVIDTASPDKIFPIAQPQLNTATFTLYEQLQQQKESRTGVSRLAQGLNQDAVNSQNAEDMINKLMAASNERIVQMARSFAEKCFRYVLQDSFSLGVENNQAVEAEFQGEKQYLDPKKHEWNPASECTAMVALTPEEQAAQAQTLLTVHGTLSADESIAPLYGMEQKYAVISDALDLLGINNPAYLGNPADPQIQQKIQQAQQKAEAQIQEAKQKEDMVLMTQLSLAQAAQGTKDRAQDLNERKTAEELGLKREGLELDAVTKSDAQVLDERQFAHDVVQDGREYELEKTQVRPVAI